MKRVCFVKLGFAFLVAFIVIFLSTIGATIGTGSEEDSERGYPGECEDCKAFNALDGAPFFIPLYSKLSRADLLDNQTRAGIFAYVQSNPGVNFVTIAAELKLPHGTLQHHLRVLERGGLIVSKRLRKYTRFYPATVRASDLSEVQERILSVIEEKPGLCQTEIGEELSISRQTVCYNVRFLEEEGYVDIVRDGRFARCYVTRNSPHFRSLG
jgi:predicted transcriptional regulator